MAGDLSELDWKKIQAVIDGQQKKSASPTGMTEKEKSEIKKTVEKMLGSIPPAVATKLESKIKASEQKQHIPPWKEVKLKNNTGKQAPIQGAVGTPLKKRAVGSISIMDQIAAITPIQPGYMFHVAIGLDVIGDFQQVNGLGMNHTAFTYREGGRNDGPHQLMDVGAQGQVQLQWGMIWRTALFDWIKSIEAGKSFRKNVTIFHLDRQRIPLRVYFLKGAFPTQWQAPALNTGSSAVALEQVTLAFDKMYMQSNPTLALDLF